MPLDPLDLYDIANALTEEERMVQNAVARLVGDKIRPIIQKCFEEHHFPRELIPELAALGLFGSTLLELTRFGGHLRVPTGGSEYGQVQVKMG